jgi:light-regulated signal transduction histidine kinase (bacteriophytochrome)
MVPQPERNPPDVIAAQAVLSGLNELSSRAGHDLLGPLNQATSLLALFIKRYGGQLDPDADKLLGFLQDASARMEGVAAGVRKYMDVAGKPPRLGSVDLNASLAASLARLAKEVTQTGAVIMSDSLPVVSADAAHMITMFDILIGNAIKFRRPEAPPYIQVSLRRAGDFRCIAIADNGIGIDPEYRDTVFLPFRRLNGAEYAGAGLGLATAKLITGMHGGIIWIESIPEWQPSLEQCSGGTYVQFTVQPE